MTYRTTEGRIVAGDRAPDAPVTGADGKTVRLFDLYRGPHATHLTFGAPAPDRPHAYTVLRPGHTAPGPHVIDTHGHAYRAYHASDGTSLLIRPDGYIGRRQEQPRTAGARAVPHGTPRVALDRGPVPGDRHTDRAGTHGPWRGGGAPRRQPAGAAAREVRFGSSHYRGWCGRATDAGRGGGLPWARTTAVRRRECVRSRTDCRTSWWSGCVRWRRRAAGRSTCCSKRC
ncbi:hypothetical protein AB0C11_39955 [Streptomyces sp. NPDC039016]|uniref:aromatic-ring hydroxylase C-terminal domain-containing protein n=1 Tax=Streptomyces sp. NPDC039016 TaxID=3154330 RepID=UPI0033F978D1